ncbi:BEM_collapsed_G0011090.mRNA.1.CDS.1 [Saccharomyces cerevisiae]|nr:CEQ_1a_G0009640.mRNA.1.CDS.1 [Saccharomyces cerevisiae]CAI4951515.1 BEM_HP_G0145480.mRNA.1.CDS.1 [Saccharomyces cerevisiae]CAI4961521.1 BEM_HP_G0151970.mRNA.1.CDS.1 [Saccharomyces cerevisiae]CAI5203295.1 BEM_HP_G0101870.mRNA.1.CDS.1 [Saccharomyces cerevisiae]CAI6618598.1 BEM_HP_G0145480.mRNA.1.CDS.1 [Saccharomyces cerevisiae]
MAGKKGQKKSGQGNHGKNSDMDVEDRLQAVVLTDSYETRFMPLTAVKPRCLLPLANVPLIEYTLEFLAKAGVHEVFLICSSHANQINDYIENSKWNLPWSPFKITTVMSPEARCTGDVMRDLDNRGIITGDFILVSGDVLTNIDFSKMLEFHKKMHLQDKDHISTMCLSKASTYPKTRTIEPAAFVLDKSTSRCIYYQDLPLPSSREKTSIQIDPELLDNVDEFVIRNDLIDCRIDICTSHVPLIFQENFDYQSLRTDFVKGVISSDILGKHIYAYLTDEYAVRVESWQTYDTISQDFLGRWCYPLVLDSNIQDDQTYSYESRHIYKEKDVVLAQSCKIGKCTAIGSGTKIGEGTKIENSVIGRNCQIGENIRIKNSFIWDDCIIGNNSIIDHSLIASNATLGSNVRLNDGCIIGFNVKIDDNMDLDRNTKISASPLKNAGSRMYDNESNEQFDQDLDDQTLAVSIVGDKGVGYIYESEVSDDEDSSTEACKEINTLSNQLDELYLSDDSISSATKKTKKRRTMSVNSIYTDREEIDSEFEDEDFEKEGIATVERAMENNHDLDTALLELNTLRMSMNVTYHEVRIATITALLRRVYHFIATQTLGPKDAVVKVFNQWGLLFKRQAFDEEEYIDLMNIIMEKIVEQSFDKPDLILFSALVSLYDNDIIEEDVIYKWWDNVSTDPRYDEVKKLTVKWVEWLQNADEESSSEEE